MRPQLPVISSFPLLPTGLPEHAMCGIVRLSGRAGSPIRSIFGNGANHTAAQALKRMSVLLPSPDAPLARRKSSSRRPLVSTGIYIPPRALLRRMPPKRRPFRQDYHFARTRMVIRLAERGGCDERVLSAMLRVRRHRFVEEALQAKAYEDITLPIGLGQTISRPSVVAEMCSLLRCEPGMRVLEIGAGSGYQTAVLAAMGLEVFAVERLEPLCSRSAALLAAMRCPAKLFCGDGTLGLPHFAPYDRIIVAAGGPVVPRPLAEQLKEGGVMIMPIGPDRARQRLKRIVRLPSGRLHISDCGPASFVDLVGQNGWSESGAAIEQPDSLSPKPGRAGA